MPLRTSVIVGDEMSKYVFNFDLSVSIQDVLDADDGKVKFHDETGENDCTCEAIEEQQ